MERECRQCHKGFTRTRKHNVYCSDACLNAARERTCQRCGKQFLVMHDKQPGLYCSNPCRIAGLEKSRPRALDLAAAKRTAAGRTRVPCVWKACPKPHELIPIVKSNAEGNHYHTDGCLQAWLAAGGGRKGKGRGPVLVCQGCGKEMGRRTPSQARQRFCADCGRRAGGRSQRGVPKRGKRGETHACSVCGTEVYRAPWEMKERAGKPVYCSPTCWQQARRDRRAIVRCTACGNERRYEAGGIPLSVDRQAMTWVCPTCRPHATMQDMRACAHCGAAFRARVKIGKPESNRFCSIAHRAAYFASRRPARVCQRPGCGQSITRRQGGKYCSRSCYAAVLEGKPVIAASSVRRKRRLSPAAKRVLDQVRPGFTGTVRELAAVAECDKNTVLSLKKAGRIVAAAAPDGPTAWHLASRRGLAMVAAS